MSDDEYYEFEDVFWIEEPEPTLAVSFVPSSAILLFDSRDYVLMVLIK